VTPLGWYMTRVFNGERTFLSPVLRPVEIGLYRLGGVDDKHEQHWLTYTVAMLFFHVGGFLILYALMRFQAVLPFNLAEQSAWRLICRSTPPSASSPTPTGRTTAAKARCPSTTLAD
jgi:K+-transporting ATPase A subunit